MNQFKVRGKVPKLRPNCNEFRLIAKNGPDLRNFFESEKIDTKLDGSEEEPFIKVRGKLALLCHKGDTVDLTIEAYKRKDGIRIRGVDIKVL